jgi:hypothetical protein
MTLLSGRTEDKTRAVYAAIPDGHAIRAGSAG